MNNKWWLLLTVCHMGINIHLKIRMFKFLESFLCLIIFNLSHFNVRNINVIKYKYVLSFWLIFLFKDWLNMLYRD